MYLLIRLDGFCRHRFIALPENRKYPWSTGSGSLYSNGGILNKLVLKLAEFKNVSKSMCRIVHCLFADKDDTLEG